MFQTRKQQDSTASQASPTLGRDDRHQDGWKVQLKHSMRGLSYSEAAQQLRSCPGAPIAQPELFRKNSSDSGSMAAENGWSASASDSGRRATAEALSGPVGGLFDNGIQPADVCQADLADPCLAAALAEVATDQPHVIAQMIRPLGGGGYEIRFFQTIMSGMPVQQWVRIDAGNSRESWPSLIARAYVRWTRDQQPQRHAATTKSALAAITGECSDSLL